MRQLTVVIGAIALFVSSHAFGQAAPADDNEPIIVTGTKGDRNLGVNFQRVARECAECKRVLAQVAKLGTPYQIKKGQIQRDTATMLESIDIHAGSSGSKNRGLDIPDGADFLNPFTREASEQSQAGRLKAQVPHHFRKDRTELAIMRRDVSSLVASFLAQLEPYVVEAAEAERVMRGASAVVKTDRGANKRNKTVDVTNAVIARLNALEFTITLPTAPAPTRSR